MHPKNYERWSFYWTEARLVLAAVALFMNGSPIITQMVPSVEVGSMFLNTVWIISGVVSVYLLIRWLANDKKLFGHKPSTIDTGAFLVAIISGLNLGYAGLTGTNLGMLISTNYTLFLIVGLIYLLSAFHLYTRFTAHDNRLF